MIERYIKHVVDPIYNSWKEFDEKEGLPLVTHCNGFVADVCAAFGYSKLLDSNGNAFMANTIHNILLADRVNWFPYPTVTEINTLIVASQRGKEHGHVNIPKPGDFVYSAKWNRMVLCVGT
jgi:hypothetical protein